MLQDAAIAIEETASMEPPVTATVISTPFCHDHTVMGSPLTSAVSVDSLPAQLRHVEDEGEVPYWKGVSL